MFISLSVRIIRTAIAPRLAIKIRLIVVLILFLCNTLAEQALIDKVYQNLNSKHKLELWLVPNQHFNGRWVISITRII